MPAGFDPSGDRQQRLTAGRGRKGGGRQGPFDVLGTLRERTAQGQQQNCDGGLHNLWTREPEPGFSGCRKRYVLISGASRALPFNSSSPKTPKSRGVFPKAKIKAKDLYCLP